MDTIKTAKHDGHKSSPLVVEAPQGRTYGGTPPEHVSESSVSLQRYLGNSYVHAMSITPPQARGAPAGVTPSRGHIAARPSSLPMVPLQARLEVGSVDDPLEHEAERVAGHAMRMPAASTPPRCACRGTPEPDGECAACKASRVARLAITPAVPALRSAPASVGAALSGPGRPLDAATRAFFEARLDTDLSAVRIHDDATAAVSARDVAAQAYTVGRDVVFGAGRYQPSNAAGRALLAHELAHVVQQTSGRTTPRIQRKAQTYTIRPDHAPMPAKEVLILMAMTSRKVSRASAIKLIENDEYACGGHPACTYGIRDTKPIEFTIGHPEPEPKRPAPAKQAPPKKAATPPVEPDPATIGVEPAPPAPLPAEIESALENPYLKRFFSMGTQEKYLQLPIGQPNPDDYVAVNFIRDAVLRLSEKELRCYRNFAAEQTLGTWTDIARSLNEFSKVKADICLAGEYIDPSPLERLRDAELFYEATMRTEALKRMFNKELAEISQKHPASASVLPQTTDEQTNARVEEMRRQVEASTMAERQALHTSGFKTVADFDRAANEFRLYFREHALRTAERMLFESGRVLQDAVARYQLRGDKVPRDCQELYDELYRTYGGRFVDQLKDAHPILRDRAALHAVSPAKNVYEFSWRLTQFANDRLRDLGFVQSNLRREPDVVFRFDVVVKATLGELGLAEDSIFAWVIREQRGKPSSTLGEKIVHYGIEVLLFALSFVSLPVGLTIGVTRAIGKTAAAGSEYAAGTREFEAGLRESAPSIAPVILAPVEELGPYAAHGIFSWLKGLRGAAQVEKLAPAAAGTERKLEQSLAPPHDTPKPAPAPHVKAPPPVTTEPAAPVPPAEAPSVIKPPVAQPPEPKHAPTLTVKQGGSRFRGTPTGLVRDVDAPSRSVQVPASHPVFKGKLPKNEPPPGNIPQQQAVELAPTGTGGPVSPVKIVKGSGTPQDPSRLRMATSGGPPSSGRKPPGEPGGPQAPTHQVHPHAVPRKGPAPAPEPAPSPPPVQINPVMEFDEAVTLGRAVVDNSVWLQEIRRIGGLAQTRQAGELRDFIKIYSRHSGTTIDVIPANQASTYGLGPSNWGTYLPDEGRIVMHGGIFTTPGVNPVREIGHEVGAAELGRVANIPKDSIPGVNVSPDVRSRMGGDSLTHVIDTLVKVPD